MSVLEEGTLQGAGALQINRSAPWMFPADEVLTAKQVLSVKHVLCSHCMCSSSSHIGVSVVHTSTPLIFSPYGRTQFPITAIREIKILKKLKHENIVNLKEIVTSKGAGVWRHFYF